MIFCVFLLTSFTFLLLSSICLLISFIFLLHSFTLLLICFILLLLSFNCLIFSFVFYFREFLTAWIISVLYWITKEKLFWKYISQRGKIQKKSFCNRISGDSLLIWKKVHLLTRGGLLIGGVLFARRTHANDTRRASLTRTLIMCLRNYFSTVQFLFLFCVSILLSQCYVCLGLFCVPSKRNAIRAAAAANNLCSSRLPLSVLPISPCATSVQLGSWIWADHFHSI